MLTNEQILKIGREYPTKGSKKLCEELGVSRTRIQQTIVLNSIKYKEIAEILKKEFEKQNND